MDEDTPASGPKKVIVIVEDSAAIAELLRDTLNAEDAYQAVSVGNGAAALELLEGVQTDLILLDLQLPGMDGIEIYDRLQQAPATAAIPILFITAQTQDARFQERGIEAVLAKPFQLNDLLARVADLLETP